MMKRLFFVLVAVIVTTAVFAQEDQKIEYRWGASTSRLIAKDSEPFSYGEEKSGVLWGFDAQMIFPNKIRNSSWLLGCQFQRDYNTGSYAPCTYGGALYFGPRLSTNGKFLKLESYIAGGIFSFHDEIFTPEYKSNSNFTSPGVKFGVNLNFDLKLFNLITGYHIYSTAGSQSAIYYSGFNLAIGL